MISSFHGAPRTKPSTRKKELGHAIVNKTARSTVEICHLDFLEVASLKHFAKKAMTSSFRGGSSMKPSISKLLS